MQYMQSINKYVEYVEYAEYVKYAYSIAIWLQTCFGSKSRCTSTLLLSDGRSGKVKPNMQNMQNMHSMHNMQYIYIICKICKICIYIHNKGRLKLSDHLVLQMQQYMDIETGELNLTPLQVPSISWCPPRPWKAFASYRADTMTAKGAPCQPVPWTDHSTEALANLGLESQWRQYTFWIGNRWSPTSLMF